MYMNVVLMVVVVVAVGVWLMIIIRIIAVATHPPTALEQQLLQRYRLCRVIVRRVRRTESTLRCIQQQQVVVCRCDFAALWSFLNSG